jgi:hypothetical protein
MRNLSLTVFILSSLVVVCPLSGNAQSASGAVETAEISADLGTRSALITVTGVDSKPIYSAKVNTRIRHGLLGVKKLDLEAFTGADGQLKITNLLEVLKMPMYIYIQMDNKLETEEFRSAICCRHIQRATEVGRRQLRFILDCDLRIEIRIGITDLASSHPVHQLIVSF